MNWYNVKFRMWENTCHKNHKLPHGQCYHTFFNYRDVYLLKNQHEPYSVNYKMVPETIFLVSGSWIITCQKQISRDIMANLWM